MFKKKTWGSEKSYEERLAQYDEQVMAEVEEAIAETEKPPEKPKILDKVQKYKQCEKCGNTSDHSIAYGRDYTGIDPVTRESIYQEYMKFHCPVCGYKSRGECAKWIDAPPLWIRSF
jgi:hypothetical protein